MENDILFSIVGALGNVYVVDKNITCKNKPSTCNNLRNIKLLKLIDNKITTQKKIIESKKSLSYIKSKRIIS